MSDTPLRLSLFNAEVDPSEGAFLELYRQCDLDSRATVLVLMRALTNPTPLNWLQAGGTISEHVGRLDAEFNRSGCR